MCACASAHGMQTKLWLSHPKMDILVLENMKISKKDKQGNLRKDKQGKMSPNTGSIAELGSFSLEKRWLKKGETEVFKTCSSVSCSGFFSTRKIQTY